MRRSALINLSKIQLRWEVVVFAILFNSLTIRAVMRIIRCWQQFIVLFRNNANIDIYPLSRF